MQIDTAYLYCQTDVTQQEESMKQNDGSLCFEVFALGLWKEIVGHRLGTLLSLPRGHGGGGRFHWNAIVIWGWGLVLGIAFCSTLAVHHQFVATKWGAQP